MEQSNFAIQSMKDNQVLVVNKSPKIMINFEDICSGDATWSKGNENGV
jgi:hypothetical protein